MRGASLSPRGKGQGDGSTGDEALEGSSSAAGTPGKAGEGSVQGEEGEEEGTPLQAPVTPGEGADSSAPLSPESDPSPRTTGTGEQSRACLFCINQ